MKFHQHSNILSFSKTVKVIKLTPTSIIVENSFEQINSSNQNQVNTS